MKLLTARHIKNLSDSGFTLIELLVVIGVLGILAAGLLATVDPLEQFRKATDATTKESAAALNAAIERYFATNQVFPWNAVVAPCTAPVTGTTAVPPTGATQVNAPVGGLWNCVTSLINAGELKPTFATSPALASLYVSFYSDSGSTPTCFDPTSKAESTTQLAIYTRWGVAQPPATCPSTTAAIGTCNWCAR